MRIATWQSSTGSGPHVAQIERGLVALGHHVEPYQPGRGYDLVLMHNHVPHRTDYVYPSFPEGVPFAFLDFAEFGWKTRLPENQRLWANGLSPVALTHDTKNPVEQLRLRRWLEGRSYPYFLREMFKGIEYPQGYWPVDYPLYWKSVYTVPPNREEYLARQLELFCQWGHSHPWRLSIENALRAAHTKCEVENRWRDGQPDGSAPYNMPQSLYFERMQASRTTVSFDGYGSGSFRMTEALCRTLLLQGPLSIRQRAPLLDGVTCREYAVVSDGEEFARTDVSDVLRCALEDAEGSYEIYERGFAHVHEHLTEKATAQYVLDVVSQHDWREATALEV